MVEQREKWSIRKCADECASGVEFEDRQWVISLEHTKRVCTQRFLRRTCTRKCKALSMLEKSIYSATTSGARAD